MSDRTKAVLLNVLGLSCCLVPPVVVSFGYFPLWRDTVGPAAVAGGSVAVAAIIAVVALGKFIKTKIKTPSPVLIFLVFYGFFALVEKVVAGLKVISFWGAVGSAAGALLFWWADRYERRE